MKLFLAFALFPFLAHASNPSPAWWETVASNTNVLTVRIFSALSKACQITTQKSLTPLTAKQLALQSIEALQAYHPVKLAIDKDRLMILSDLRILKSFPAPDENDCDNWARITTAVTAETWPLSKQLQKLPIPDLLDNFINSYLSKIDAYSHYTPADPVELKDLKNPASIGIRYRKIGKYLEITEILPDSPAAQSSLSVLDRIKSIDGKEVLNMTSAEIVNALRDEEGTTVSMVVRQDGKNNTITIQRFPVKEAPVSYFYDLKTNLMTIKITSFSSKTENTLRFSLNQARQKKAEGLIIDLRGNMGGLLKQAVLSANILLPPYFQMIKTVSRTDTQSFTSTIKKRKYRFPIVILVDAKTASSAEYFAGVLQEYRHAVVIGTPTYGKGVLQSVDDILNEGKLSVTTANYQLPSGYSPQKYGLYPNVCTSTMKKSDEDIATVNRIVNWQKGNEERKKLLLSYCPKQIRKDNSLDDDIAVRILKDPKLYESALSIIEFYIKKDFSEYQQKQAEEN